MVENVQRIEDGDALGFRWGGDGEPHVYREADGDGAALEAYRKAVAEGLIRGEAGRMSELERETARELQARAGIGLPWGRAAYDTVEWLTTKAAVAGTGNDLILAYFPFDDNGDDDDDLAKTLSALCGGSVAPADVHLTLLYLGDPAGYDTDAVCAAVKLCSLWQQPLEGCVAGLGRFVGPGDQDVIVALVDIPKLGDLRFSLKDAVWTACARGCDPGYDMPGPLTYGSEAHGYVPHFTVGYIPKTQASPKPLEDTLPVCIDCVTVASGSQRARYEFPTPGDDANPTPFLAARAAAGAVTSVLKAGRVISKKDLAMLQDVHAKLTDAADAVGAHLRREADRRTQAEGTETSTADDAGAVADAKKAELVYVAKADQDFMERGYTFGPLYAPNRKDAHGEYTDEDTLQQSVWDYVQSCVDAGDNRLNLQHGDHGDVKCARWVECAAWPYDHTVVVKNLSTGEDHEVEMPAGTVYMGVIWDEDVRPLVKAGKIGGLSLGGKAVRVDSGEDLPPMGYKLAARTPLGVEQVVEKAMHKFAGEAGGKCEICGGAADNGQHYGVDAAE